jgi:hypothetical protein
VIDSAETPGGCWRTAASRRAISSFSPSRPRAGRVRLPGSPGVAARCGSGSGAAAGPARAVGCLPQFADHPVAGREPRRGRTGARTGQLGPASRYRDGLSAARRPDKRATATVRERPVATVRKRGSCHTAELARTQLRRSSRTWCGSRTDRRSLPWSLGITRQARTRRSTGFCDGFWVQSVLGHALTYMIDAGRASTVTRFSFGWCVSVRPSRPLTSALSAGSACLSVCRMASSWATRAVISSSVNAPVLSHWLAEPCFREGAPSLGLFHPARHKYWIGPGFECGAVLAQLGVARGNLLLRAPASAFGSSPGTN